MLKDKIFYPLAALIVVLMIALALSFGERIDLTDPYLRHWGHNMSGLLQPTNCA